MKQELKKDIQDLEKGIKEIMNPKGCGSELQYSPIKCGESYQRKKTLCSSCLNEIENLPKLKATLKAKQAHLADLERIEGLVDEFEKKTKVILCTKTSEEDKPKGKSCDTTGSNACFDCLTFESMSEELKNQIGGEDGKSE